MSTPKSHQSRPEKTTPPTPAAAPSQLLRTRFSPAQLLTRFKKLLPVRLLSRWLALSPKTFYQRAFTPQITLWYCVFQRLSSNHTLAHALTDARDGGADRLCPRGKLRLSAQLTSESTASFSDARQRLPLDLFQKTLRHTAQQIHDNLQAPDCFGLQVGFLDGSTLRLRPYGDVPEHFPPHRGGKSKKPPYWCVARVLGVFSLASGAMLDSETGPLSTSEQAMAASVFRRPWKGWTFVADRNFGVYSVARATDAAQAHLLTRLTQARAAKLARSVNQPLAPGLDAPVSWQPTGHDQCPEGLAPAPVQGRLVVVHVQQPGFRPVTLYLFTTLLDAQVYTPEVLAQLYGKRWQVEVDLRYVKTQLDLGLLECHSAEMFRKEWWAGLIAYNLIRWTMGAAAAQARVPVQTLSFSRTRDLLLNWCVRCSGHQLRTGSWTRLLDRIAKAQQPKRSKPRLSEPRAIRPFNTNCAKLYGSRAIAREQLAAANAKSDAKS